MATRILLTRLLLVWSLALGLVQAAVRPVFIEVPREIMPACADCGEGCDGQERTSPANCMTICLIWCVSPGFSALAEAENQPLPQMAAGPRPRWEDFLGQTRNARPLLPPPKV